MLKIGEFSAITGISINMLRNYNKVGILVPHVVDENNGYRYYGEDQVADAHRVQILKELGFGLKEIPQLNAYSDTEVKYMISRKILEKQAEVALLKDEIDKMRQLEEVYELYSRCNFEINMAVLPARKVISLTESLSTLEEETRLWNRIERLFEAGTIERSSRGIDLATTHIADYVYNVFSVEVQATVKDGSKIPQGIGFEYKEMPPLEVAMVSFDGTPEQINNVSRYVRKYVRGLGYEAVGAPWRKHVSGGGQGEVYFYKVIKTELK